MKTVSVLKIATLVTVASIVSACSSNPKEATPTFTPSPQAQIVETARGPSITLNDVLFDFDESSLRSEAAYTIDKAVSYLKANPQRRALVEGHTDHTGDADFNKWLSMERSKSIKNALVARGINENRIKMSGLGETQPVADNSTPPGRQANRRVEIIFPLDGQDI